MNWSVEPFELLYRSIQNGEVDLELFNGLLTDLKALNLDNNKRKNQTSRSQLEKGEAKLGDGATYQFNEVFVISAIKLSDELNLDELIIAELMLSNLNGADYTENDDFLLMNNGKIQYFMRRQYILQIVAYIVNCLQRDDPILESFFDDNTVSNVIQAFKSIHTNLVEIKQLVNKAQILDHYDVLFQKNVRFKRDFLLKEYDILSQILTGLSQNRILSTQSHITSLIDHITSLDANDFFIIYYLPAVFQTFGELNHFADGEVKSLHQALLKDLKSPEIYSKPVHVTFIFVFLTFFISWCKEKPSERAMSLDFKTAVDEPMTTAVELGAIEQLLVFTADTSVVEKDKSIDLFYDIRSLLQRHIPKLIPKNLLDDDTQYTNSSSGNVHNAMNNISGGNAGFLNSNYGSPAANKKHIPKYQFDCVFLSEQTEITLLSTTHVVLQRIIADCAFLLTKIKDAEEDSLLSGEDLTLDDVSVKADLERFFLTIYYFYASRPEYAKVFWEDKESNAFGFIAWASKCSDSLIRSCFYLMISSLSFGAENSVNVFHYFNDDSTVSWNIICQCISDYIAKISSLNNAVQHQQTLGNSEIDTNLVALEEGLNEEAIIFLSSLFTLIGSVAHDVDENIKLSLSTMFSDVLFEFSKLDTPLIGACFMTLSHIVPTSTKDKAKFWLLLDAMIFKNATLTNTHHSYRTAFSSIFGNYSEVLGFLRLFAKLLQIDTSNQDHGLIRFGNLEFPAKLGQSYRKAGIWPYFNYIFTDLLIPSEKLTDEANKIAIQLPIMESINTALCSFDYRVILNSVPVGADLNRLTTSGDFFEYIQESPATAVFNYLFQEKCYQSIFKIIVGGSDELINIGSEGNYHTLLIQNACQVISRTLQHQETYLDELIPIVKKNRKEIFMIPKDFGHHGLRSFYDAIFFNLNVIAHFGLYVGVENYIIASESISILKKMSLLYNKNCSSTHLRNKLLIVLDAVDESARIKDAFISQIETPIDIEEKLQLKLEILDLLASNLSYSDQEMTVAHFLLGFQVSDAISVGPKLSTFIASGISLLGSLLNLLQASLESVSPANIDYAPMRLAAMTMEIILKLCRNPVTSAIIFDVLLENEFLDTIVMLDPQITKYTSWNNRLFETSSLESVHAFNEGPSLGAFISFLSYRNHLTQFFSLFIHRIFFVGTTFQISTYINYLISSNRGSAKILSFLNTLNYGSIPVSKYTGNLSSNLSKVSFELDLIPLKPRCTGNIFDFTEVDARLSLFKRANEVQPKPTMLTLVTNRSVDGDPSEKKEDAEMLKLRSYITDCLSNSKISDLQLCILHSWVQLVQIIVTDGKLGTLERCDFILEIFSTIVPKINDYVEFDVKFSEELVSLAVFLYEIYNQDRRTMDKYDKLDTRLDSLFKVCIHGITSPLSSISLRSDFYVLTNQYLVRILNDEKLSKEILQNLRVINEKFVEVISNDAIYGQGTSRITAILLLDSLVQVADWNKDNIILESLTKNAHLLLIIRTLKNIDNILKSTTEATSIDDLLYEMTAFKATVFFLIRIAQTRTGSQSLIQNKLLQVIGQCSFLKVDPELGLNLHFDENPSKGTGVVNINIGLESAASAGRETEDLSLFELFIPVFKLICTVLISVGSENEVVINNTRQLLSAFRKLLVGVFKKDALNDSEGRTNYLHGKNDVLGEMVMLITLLCTLTDYNGKECL
ncbi:Nup192p KNAG_0F03270 [Huiozyma naganishii CBS 8797]|uniref:Nucleoporin n=1 Tax=Huiozyma naganishii (strain ATCC MYA-139 / BCRC 22969 / CBS 8797 / KCTC 17520 / NBRC 10181 / NCYC 3082 / Yp74L-3) TaxID=1071383 RepID=J7S7J2_HUIN7|nr:hypothetical protein KNAG_0F03270 [Kazachstania naganishii CBS 8797]CCK70989.1 hypothetical protein KNAG_0F03270 [Kazachstania naganishii CBS 8797]